MHSTAGSKVREFQRAMGSPLNARLEEASVSLNFGLIREEYGEFFEEQYAIRMSLIKGRPITNQAVEKLLKELADLVYVCYHFANTFGLPLEEAITLVHESNMSKLGEDGKPIRREDGKVLKGPNYKPADLSNLVSVWRQCREADDG